MMDITTNGTPGDFYAVKIIELSKKIRDLSSKFAAEVDKSRRLSERLKRLEAETTLREGEQPERLQAINCETDCEQTKLYKARLSRCETLLTSLKCENFKLKHELRLSRKVLEAETGESISNLSIWLKKVHISDSQEAALQNNCKRGWRARHQQILVLNSRLKHMEDRMQLLDPVAQNIIQSEIPEVAFEGEISGATSLDITLLSSGDLQRSQHNSSPLPYSQPLDKSLTCMEKLKQENILMKEEITSLKTRCDRLRARERASTSDLTESKHQIQKILEKGRHDDELIQSLLQSRENLKSMIGQSNQMIEKLESQGKTRNDEFLSMRLQKDQRIEQLQEILKQKDDEIVDLERRVAEFSKQGGVGDKNTEELNEKDNAVGDHLTATKKIEFLTIERDGLRELVIVMNQRLDRLTEQYEQLENGNAACKSQTGRTRRPQRRKQNGPCSIQAAQNFANLEDWLKQFISLDYSQSSATWTGLPVSATALASKYTQELQSAINQAINEITSLKFTCQQMTEGRKEDFTIFTQTVEKLNNCIEVKDE